MVTTTVTTPIPIIVFWSIVSFILSIICAGWASHDLRKESIANALRMGFYSLGTAFTAALLISIVLFDIDVPVSGRDWVLPFPFFVINVIICVLVFGACQFVGHIVQKAEEKEKTKKRTKKELEPLSEIDEDPFGDFEEDIKELNLID